MKSLQNGVEVWGRDFLKYISGKRKVKAMRYVEEKKDRVKFIMIIITLMKVFSGIYGRIRPSSYFRLLGSWHCQSQQVSYCLHPKKAADRTFI